jgi:hypothetical protein
MKVRQALFDAFNIRPGEGLIIALLSGYSFLAGVFQAYYISLANASFLADFGVDYLPRGYLVTGVVGYLVGSWLARLQGRLVFTRLVSVTLVLPLALVCIFRLSFWLVPGPWLTFAMFVCIGPFISLVYFVFRALIGRLLNLRQSKRLFGLISSGDVLSAIIGFFSVPLVISLLGNVIELLLVAAVALALGLLLVLHINQRFAAVLVSAQAPPEQGRAGGLSELFQDRYLLLIVTMSMLVVIGFYYVDYIFLAQVRDRFSDLEFLARFISVLYGIIRVVELLVKTFLSGRLLNNYGLKFGLVALPVLLCMTVGPVSLLSLDFFEAGQAIFLLVVLSKLIERVGAKSFHDPSFNVLYQPLPDARRLGVQTRVEALIQPIAIGLAGGTLWFFSLFASFAMVVVVLALIVVAWTLVALSLHREYRVSLQDNLARRVGVMSEDRPDSAQIVANARDGAMGDGLDWLEYLSTAIDAMRSARNDQGQVEEAESVAGSERNAVIRHRIEEAVGHAAWNMACILDLEGEPEAGEVQRALGLAIDERRTRVFDLLCQLYEPRQIELVRESFSGGDPDGRIYAMEQLDVLVDPPLKALLFPLLEDLQLSQRLRSLERHCPQQQLTVPGRLCDIVNCEFSRADRWIRACALQALSRIDRSQVYDEQVAHLFNPDLLLRETAAQSIREVAPERLDSYLQRVPQVLARGLEKERDLTIIERVLLLRQIPLLSSLRETVLAALAEQSQVIDGAADQMVVEAGEALDRVLLLAEGGVRRVETDLVGRAPLLLDGWLWTSTGCARDGVRALDNCRLFSIERNTFIEVLNDWPGVAERIVEPNL